MGQRLVNITRNVRKHLLPRSNNDSQQSPAVLIGNSANQQDDDDDDVNLANEFGHLCNYKREVRSNAFAYKVCNELGHVRRPKQSTLRPFGPNLGPNELYHSHQEYSEKVGMGLVDCTLLNIESCATMLEARWV
jgi:hypothetical protein